jgi:hypothetical protein
MRNVGTWDRFLRFSLGVILVGLAVVVTETPVWRVAFGFIGFVMLLTAATGFCPLYTALGIGGRRHHLPR